MDAGQQHFLTEQWTVTKHFPLYFESYLQARVDARLVGIRAKKAREAAENAENAKTKGK